MKKGIFIISLDTELAWGRIHHRKLEEYRERLSLYRSGVKWLLEIFEEYNVHATWNIVGHLFLSSCNRNNMGIAHPELPRPKYDWVEGDWYKFDPCSSIEDDSDFYGTDIIDMILNSRVKHEIGSHSFGHIDFKDSGCTHEVALADIKKCVDVAEKQGLHLQSLVFPQNKISHLDVLAECGFKCFRGVFPGALSSGTRFSKEKWKYLLKILLGRGSPVGFPSLTEEGIWNVPLSQCYRQDKPIDSAMGVVPMFLKDLRAKRSLNLAAKKRMIYHMSLHPLDFGWKSKKIRIGLIKIIKHATKLREKGEILIKTMSQVCEN